jgi:glycosyltransferase family protein
MKLSIVIPCYNEEKNIPLILQSFAKHIKNEHIEVILVNNGSTDNTATVLDELLPGYPFAKTVLVSVNKGYGYGILQGLNEANGDYIGWTHADMQTDPGDIVKAYRIIQSCSDLVYVKGHRKGRSFFDNIFTWGMGCFETVYLGQKLWDINAQPNIFPMSFYLEWERPPYDFSLDLYAVYLAKRKKMKVIRFEVMFPERIHGTSSWNTGLKAKWKFIKRTIDFSLKLKRGGIL